ncbi:hypothetical protein BJ742DRAFT_839797 [Cladochytrium replicatum]|nr:hypothetical protein BJ742DRAFT_839797 [Cladochytrium replicatum]
MRFFDSERAKTLSRLYKLLFLPVFTLFILSVSDGMVSEPLASTVCIFEKIAVHIFIALFM